MLKLILICLVLICGCSSSNADKLAEEKRITDSWNRFVERLSTIESIKSTTGEEYKIEMRFNRLESSDYLRTPRKGLKKRYFGRFTFTITKQPDIEILYILSLRAESIGWTLISGREAPSGITQRAWPNSKGDNEDDLPSLSHILNQLGIEHEPDTLR